MARVREGIRSLKIEPTGGDDESAQGENLSALMITSRFHFNARRSQLLALINEEIGEDSTSDQSHDDLLSHTIIIIITSLLFFSSSSYQRMKIELTWLEGITLI